MGFKNCLLLIVAIIVIEQYGFSSSQMDRNVTKLIINTDPGPDDTLAILFAILSAKANPNLEILGITSTFGNAQNNYSVINSLKSLDQTKLLGRIPVYPGAETAIKEVPEFTEFFGKDGLSDFFYPNPPSYNQSERIIAVNALIDLVNQFPGEVTVLSLGPLTNIALAFEKDPQFFAKLDNLFILGGKIEAGPAEFNFNEDPEANRIVFRNTRYLRRPPVLLTYDTYVNCHNTSEVMEWRENVFGRINSSLVEFLNKADGYMVKLGHWEFSDGLLTVLALHSSLVTSLKQYCVDACVEKSCRGQITVRDDKLGPCCGSAHVIETLDFPGFLAQITRVLKG